MGPVVDKLSSTLQCSSKRARSLLEACAESCAQAQENNLKQTLSYIRSMQQAGLLDALSFQFRNSFDETPIKIRVAWGLPDSFTVEVAKMYVVESSWAMIVRFKGMQEHSQDELLVLHGSYSPSIRVANGMNGESIAGVLANVSVLSVACRGGGCCLPNQHPHSRV